MVSVAENGLKVVGPESGQDEQQGHGWPTRWSRELDHEWYGVCLPPDEAADVNRLAHVAKQDTLYRVLSRTARTLGFFADVVSAAQAMHRWPQAVCVAVGTKILLSKPATAGDRRAA